jgi:hypothetical protein
MNLGTTIGEPLVTARLHAVAHLVAPPPGATVEWFTVCAGEGACTVPGSFDPHADRVCPACRDFLLDAA